MPYADMDKMMSLSKRRGFMFQSSEIYGGLASTWDYGPLGVELKRNVKEAWWRSVITERDDMVGLDAAILMHPKVWVASGHVENFSDPLVECKKCNLRHRADQLFVWEFSYIDEYERRQPLGCVTEVRTESHPYGPSATAQKAAEDIARNRGGIILDTVHVGQVGPNDPRASCPACGGKLGEPRRFNLMFKTFMGPVEDTANEVYLRPETAQGIFVNFKNVLDSTRKKLPFGIGQIGKSFRNEITPGNFTFRTREFEQMEVEFFVKPGDDDEWLEKWIDARFQWYLDLGIRPENLRKRPHDDDELAHYAKACIDIEYRFPWGWGELEGIANRGDYDLRQHQEVSGQDMTYFDEAAPEGEEKRYLPYVIEPSGGVDRSTLAFWLDAYDEEPDGDSVRVVSHIHRNLAPITVAALPLSRNEKLLPTARRVYDVLRKHFRTQYDDAQSIGRRYRRQDEIGTPYCVTIDFDTIDDDQVTIRDRDSMHQSRVPVSELVDILKDKLEHAW
jgi:glycyl-tRNA synthetase